MRIQSTANGGFADVEDEYAESLIASGAWKRPRKPRAPRQTKTAPSKEQKTEE